MLRQEYSDPPVIVLRMGEGMVNLSAPPERVRSPRAQDRMARVNLAPEVSELVRVATHAIVIGCGGTGWYVAMTLAMSDLCDHIILYDGDTVEEVNLNRLPVPHGAIGYPKAEVLATEIVRVRPSQLVSAFNEWFPADEMQGHVFGLLQRSAPSHKIMTGAGELYESSANTGYVREYAGPPGLFDFKDALCLLFDCTDNPVFQNGLAAEMGEMWDSGIGIVFHTRVSYDGISHITIKHGTVARILDEQAGRYAEMPSWALPAQLAAVLGVYSALERVGEYGVDHDVGAGSLPPVASIHNSYGSVLNPTPEEVRSG